MIPLSATTQTLKYKLAGSVSSTNPKVLVAYKDQNKDGNWTKWNNQVSTANGTSDVTACAAPQQSFVRCIESVHIRNLDSASVTIIFMLDDGGTQTQIHSLLITTLRGGGYEDRSGWYAS